MDTNVIRFIIELASRAPMSQIERHWFNQNAQMILTECQLADEKVKEESHHAVNSEHP